MIEDLAFALSSVVFKVRRKESRYERQKLSKLKMRKTLVYLWHRPCPVFDNYVMEY